MRLSIQEIQYFLTVVETGSITKAANQLYISQPALSQAIMKIESNVGVPLLVRTKKKLDLTPEGELFVKNCSEIIYYIGMIEKEIDARVQQAKNELRVGIPTFLGSRILPPALRTCRDEYPDMQVILTEKTSKLLEDDLLQQNIDLAIFPLPIKSSKIIYDVLFECPMCIIMSRNSSCVLRFDGALDLPGSRVDLIRLQDATFLSTNASIGQRSALVLDSILKRAKISPKVVLASSNFNTVKQMVAHDMGVALIPRIYISDRELADLNLVCAELIEEQSCTWTVVIARHEGTPLSRCAKDFTRVLQKYYG